MMLAREIKDGHVHYNFVCEGCKAEGELGVPLDQHGTFGCPENCGAVYIQWKNLEGKYELTCVVCPVFEESDEFVAEGAD
jgi:hypothetical protein